MESTIYANCLLPKLNSQYAQREFANYVLVLNLKQIHNFVNVELEYTLTRTLNVQESKILRHAQNMNMRGSDVQNLNMQDFEIFKI